MKICHLTSVHIPFDTRIFYRECASLRDAGHEVHLVAKHDRDEVVDGIIIHALPKQSGKLRRMLTTTSRAYRTAVKLAADVYHFHDPELMPVGALLKLRGKTVICDIHEDYPAYIRYKEWIPRLLRRPVAWTTGVLEMLFCTMYDAVITVTPRLTERFSRVNRRTLHVCNFPRHADIGAASLRQPQEERPASVAYIGSITRDRGVGEMVAAMEMVNRTKPVTLVLGGSFAPPELEDAMRALPAFGHVDYRGFLSRSAVADVLSEVRAGLVATQDCLNHRVTYITKIFEYMAAGIPVILWDFPLWRSIVGPENCGILVEPMNLPALADAILHVIDHPDEAEEMGKRGRAAVERMYNWTHEEKKLLALYHDLAP